MRGFARLMLCSMMVGAGVGCGGGGEPAPEEETEDTSGMEAVAEPEPEPEPEPPAPGRARLIHAAAGSSRIEIGGAVGDAALGAAAFSAATPYAEVEGGAQVSVSVEDGEPVTATGPAAGAPGTFVVYSDAEAPTDFAVLPLVDEPGTVTGQQRARVVNALLGAESIDVCMPGATARAAGTPVFQDVAYGDVGGIPSFPSRYQPVSFAGEVTLQIRQHADTPCSGRSLGNVTLPAIDINVAHNLTMIVVGRTSGRPAVPKAVLVCQDAPGDGTCASVRVR